MRIRQRVMDRSVSSVSDAVTWHICWQAALGRNLLACSSLVERIRERLIDAHRAEGRVLFDYLIAVSEIHVLTKLSRDQSPGDVARTVASVIARWVRQAQGVRGPVFAGRYHAHRITSDDSLRDQICILAWRPVALGACVAPSHYPHSALRTTLGRRIAKGFDARPVLALFGDSVPAARAALRARLAKRPTDVQMRQWELSRGLALAVGTVGPLSTMAREVRGAAAVLVAAAGDAGIDGALCLLERWVLARLGVRDGTRLADAPRATGARGRALVGCLALDMSLCSAASVARHFKRAKATLSEQMTACRKRPADQLILQTPLKRVAEEAMSLAARSR